MLLVIQKNKLSKLKKKWTKTQNKFTIKKANLMQKRRNLET